MAKFTGDRVDSEASLKPDITFFSKNDTADFREDPEKVSVVTSFLRMELFVELKHDTQYDPFRDLANGEMEERDSINGDNTRGQCLLYAANQLAYQHRLFAFSLVICGKKARFIRWDREGVVVSAAIDCSQCQDLVIEFLQRFNQLTAEQRGLDPTAIPATPEEIGTFEAAVAKIKIESLKHTIGDRQIYPRFRLEVRGADDDVSHYIVGKALDYNLGVTGRCTRGFLALDLSTKECVFLKDMWRPNVPGIEPEHIWYEKLAEAKIPHLVKFKHAFDVVSPIPSLNYFGTAVLNPMERRCPQRGLTSRLACLFPSQGALLQGHVHYRLVQNEICRPLSEFTNSRHLVSVILDSLKGEKSADPAKTIPANFILEHPACSSSFLDASLFHRDVSFGNIMIGLDKGGRLNDWDLCRGVNVDKSLEGPRTVGGLPLVVIAPVFTSVCRGPGSSCRPGYSRILGRNIRLPTTSSPIGLSSCGRHYIGLNTISPKLRPSIWNTFLISNDHYQVASSRVVQERSKCMGAGVRSSMKLNLPASRLMSCSGICGRFSPGTSHKGEKPPGRETWVLVSTLISDDTLSSDEGPEPSVSPQEVIDLFEAALKRPGWIDDKVADQFPRAGNKGASGMPLMDLDNGDNHCDPNRGKKRGLSKSLGIDLEQLAAKRQKGN